MENEYIEISSGCWLRRDEIKGFRIVYNDKIIGLIKKKMIGDFFKKWTWLLFPVFVTFSVIWSDNVMRGILTTGILWLLYFAAFVFWRLKKEILNDDHKKIFWKWFFGSSLLVCIWCW